MPKPPAAEARKNPSAANGDPRSGRPKPARSAKRGAAPRPSANATAKLSASGPAWLSSLREARGELEAVLAELRAGERLARARP